MPQQNALSEDLIFTGAKLPRTQKDLTADFEASWYRNTKGQVILPCRMLKACIVKGGGDNVGGTASAVRAHPGKNDGERARSPHRRRRREQRID